MGRYEGNNKAHLRPSDYDNNGDIVPEYYSNWKRHIVDNGYNADWKCKKCGYISKLEYPPTECPKCMRGEEE